MGLSWLYQSELSQRLIAAQKQVLPLAHHRIGRMAQEAGYYIDVGVQQSGLASRSGRDSDWRQAFDISLYFASAMEHGVIEQLQGPQAVAASTIKLIHLANQSTDPDRDELFRVDATTFAQVQPWLKGYSSALLQSLQHDVSNGATLLLTEHALNALGQWRGTGYITASARRLGMIISGGYFGGYSGNPGAVETTQVAQNGQSAPNYDQSGASAHGLLPTTSSINRATVFGADPVDMASGAFVFEHTDLTLGEAAPRGLTWGRHYTSSRRHLDGSGLGYGWRHAYDMIAVERSAPEAALGGTTPADMAPYLIATMAALDVHASSPTAKAWATAGLMAKWGVDQLRLNAVSITLGKDNLQFIRLPSGVYQAPAGLPMSLTRDPDGTYVLRERLGNTLHFPPHTGYRIASVTDLDGLSMTFAYNTAGQLTTVTDAYQRTLTLSYTGDRIT